MIVTSQISDLHAVINQVIDLSIVAGDEILRFYKSNYDVRNKSNNTPVTEADITANEVILSGLAKLSPHIPIISEESSFPEYSIRSTWQQYWLIDPLDGTKSFVNGDDQFTVNIALIDGIAPILGVVHSPVEQRTYWGLANSGAWRVDGKDTSAARSISVWQCPGDRVRIIAPNSRTRHEVEIFKNILDSNQIAYEISHSSSSIKFCRVAEGAADIFPSFGPTSEWDTAAAQCVVECAGGTVKNLSGERIQYNKADSKLRNPPFFAAGAGNLDWQRLMPQLEI